MPLNKQKGNMYGFVTHTWNPIKGRCPHNCSYCYMFRFWRMMNDDTFRLDEKELETDLGENKFIFVGSSTDMFQGDLMWITKVLTHIAKYSDNEYLFQTKIPRKYGYFNFSQNQIIGITLETNRLDLPVSIAQPPPLRARSFSLIAHNRKMVSIEPILDFNTKIFIRTIKRINPEFVSIGADSGHNNLPEPPKEKVIQLITELEKFTKVHQKPNLKRLTNGS